MLAYKHPSKHPAYSAELEADMKAGRIAIGGCELTGDDPAWKCMECETGIYRK
jgi:hypothetical protein